MRDYFECVKEYKNIYNYAILAQEELETADTVYKLSTFFNTLRKATEAILNKLIEVYSVQAEEGLNLFGKIDLLYKLHIIDKDSKDNFHAMRMDGNDGSHAGETMDTRSERTQFKEQKKRAEYLFKCLYVECCNFANEYMPNANKQRAIDNVSNSSAGTSQNVEKAKSSVTYGSAQDGSTFTVKEEYGNYSNANFFDKISSLLMWGSFGLFIVFALLDRFGIINNPFTIVMGVRRYAFYILQFPIVMLAGYICSGLSSVIRKTADKETIYQGRLKVGEYTLGIDLSGVKASDVRATINGQDIVINEKDEQDYIIDGDETKAYCIGKYDTKDGFVIKIYTFDDFTTKENVIVEFPRFNIVINDQLVVEGDKIKLDKLQQAEASRINYISDPQIKAKWMN